MTSDEPPPSRAGGRWPREPGHGLWLARQVADQMTLRSDSRGTIAAITFVMPAIPA
jgi:hypothetical protein